MEAHRPTAPTHTLAVRRRGRHPKKDNEAARRWEFMKPTLESETSAIAHCRRLTPEAAALTASSQASPGSMTEWPNPGLTQFLSRNARFLRQVGKIFNADAVELPSCVVVDDDFARDLR
jgi:hypothetical protein